MEVFLEEIPNDNMNLPARASKSACAILGPRRGVRDSRMEINT